MTKNTPDQILEAIKTSENKPKGQLKIFLGMCAGVGKTYSMLEAARTELAKKRNVCIGVVETHGRTETEALLNGIKILPKKEIFYKNSKFYEMDLDLILKEKPDLVIVDELAHSNIPGSRHLKRYQDIEEILHAGIDVFTTLNIQHIESRNDFISRILNITIQETVPDNFLDLANEIELIDLPVPDLIQRLNDGKVYFEDRIASAKENFFKEEKISALREIALRFVAEKVNKDLKISMITKGLKNDLNLKETLLVPILNTFDSSNLIRSACLAAEKLNASWFVLYVTKSSSFKNEQQQIFEKNISLVKELGGDVLTISSLDAISAIKEICYSKNITKIIIQRPTSYNIFKIFFENHFLNKLIKETNDFEIYIINGSPELTERNYFSFDFSILTAKPKNYFYVFVYIVFIAAFCMCLSKGINYYGIGVVFLMSFLLFSLLGTIETILFVAAAFALIWDYFFIPPPFSLIISSVEDQILFVSFFVVATVCGIFLHRLRIKERLLVIQERETRALYEMVKQLSVAKHQQEVCYVLFNTIKNFLNFDSVIFLSDKNQKLTMAYPLQNQFTEKEIAVAEWTFQNEKPAGFSTKTLSGSRCLCMPFKGKVNMIGVVCMYSSAESIKIDFERQEFLETILAQSAFVVERMQAPNM